MEPHGGWLWDIEPRHFANAIPPPISFRPISRTPKKRRPGVLSLARTGMLPEVGRPETDQTKEADFGQNGQKHLGYMPFYQLLLVLALCPFGQGGPEKNYN